MQYIINQEIFFTLSYNEENTMPILLNELDRKGVLKKGQRIILAGFGAGLSWGASVLEWEIDSNTKG